MRWGAPHLLDELKGGHRDVQVPADNVQADILSPGGNEKGEAGAIGEGANFQK